LILFTLQTDGASSNAGSNLRNHSSNQRAASEMSINAGNEEIQLDSKLQRANFNNKKLQVALRWNQAREIHGEILFRFSQATNPAVNSRHKAGPVFLPFAP
jgi:hypothetical protein